ncbi:LPS translocon maturation chaperone LptM [Thiomicrorhabdus cannonii]|uniref:LPS translocon maturation chaperone LptM n=1 Tax=Thiomicrorhabdus cannonii TaxID=2748011 RepID=UPI0015BECA9B|nr:hypothetical protein [Thiomicrorhabdus cannonii]
MTRLTLSLHTPFRLLRILGITLCLGLALGGCGKKGPLTLPEATQDVQSEPPSNSNTPAASQTESGH